MTKENLIKHLAEYRKNGNKEAEADILKKYPNIEKEVEEEKKAKK